MWSKFTAAQSQETLSKLFNYYNSKIHFLYAPKLYTSESGICIAVWIMRKRQPNIDRPFKVPAYKIIVILGVIINIGLIITLDKLALMLSGCWLVLGIIVYFAYSKRNSKLNNP